MLLTKDGITLEVLYPPDIARLKHLGYTEVKPAVKAGEPEVEQPAEAPPKPAPEKAPRKREA